MHLRKYEEAIEEITECLATYSSFQEGYLCLACLYLKQKRYKLAIENYEHALKINNRMPTTYIQLAYCYQTMKEYNKAIEFTRDALGKFPKEAELLMIFVECSLAQNQKE
jgi:tetratricopeptide (TPR) repeat protein